MPNLFYVGPLSSRLFSLDQAAKSTSYRAHLVRQRFKRVGASKLSCSWVKHEALRGAYESRVGRPPQGTPDLQIYNALGDSHQRWCEPIEGET